MTSIQPVSYQQRQFYWLQCLDPHSSAYSIPLVFTISGSLDMLKLRSAFNKLVADHELFRMVFTTQNGSLGVSKSIKLNSDIEYTDMSKFDSDAIFEYLDSFIRKPFKMSEFLFRSVLIQIDTNDYVWCTVLHHCISDLRTKELIANTISQTYNEHNQNCSATNPLLKDYVVYSKEQHDWVNSKQASMQKKFWIEFLQSTPQTLSLPIDFSRPSFLKLSGDVESIEFSEDISERIKCFSTQNDTTPYLCLLTAYVVLLGRYSNQEQFIIGIPFTNRRSDSYKETIGCFVNTLPIPIDLRGDLSILDLLKSIRKNLLLAHRNQELPTEIIVKETLSSKLSMDRNPLYQVGFTFAPFVSMEFDNCSIKHRYMHQGGSQLDLFATFWEESNSFEGVFEYNDSLFLQSTIERWVKNFTFLVENFIENPDKSVQEIPLICNEEKDMIAALSKSPVKIENTMSLFPDLFENVVRCYPSKAAVVFNKREMTYGELHEKSKCVCHHLMENGIGNGHVVAVLMERSDDMLAAVTGVLLSGATYLPLDPQFPFERKRYILDDANVSGIITDDQNYLSIKECKCKVFNYSKINIRVDNGSVRGAAITGSTGAYMIYTSGSTGNPKGVTITHSNLGNFIQSMMVEPGISYVDKMLAVTTISFDIHVMELLVPLAAGASIVIAPAEAQNDAAKLIDLFTYSDISIMQATPATWKMLCSSGWKGKKGAFTILCGGESMSKELSVQLLQRCSRLFNMYGPTETTVWSTYYQVKGNELTIPIGRPVANTDVLITDTKDNQVPLGVWGELLIGGDGVSNGYHNRDTLTSEKFLTIGKSEKKAKRYYKTGDLCRLTDDGLLECAGRSDNQIKLRGYRIELEEIEHVIESFPGVKSAVTIVHGQDETAMLVAFIVPKNSQIVMDIKTVRDYLVSKLPLYMVPARFIQLTELPMTPNRKVDRKVLNSHNSISQPEILSKIDSFSADKTEKILIQIWAGLLHLEIRDVDTTFFDAGGNSLLLVKLKDSIYTRLGIEVSVPLLLQYPTICALAKYLKSNEFDGNLNDTQSRVALQRMALNRMKKR